MKTSVGYSVILNIVIVFIVIIFGTIAMCLSYYRAFKVSNAITLSVEKYEGYNKYSEIEIINKLSSLGYGSSSVKCSETRGSCSLVKSGTNSTQYSEGQMGYCVYACPGNDYVNYKITTNMLLNIPVIHDILNIPVESNTRKIYGFNDLTEPKVDNLEGTYYISTTLSESLNPKYYIHVYYILKDNGTRLVTYLDHLTENTTWEISKWKDTDFYLIKSVFSDKYMSLDVNNSNVVIWEYLDPESHLEFLWRFEKYDGYYRIINAYNGKALYGGTKNENHVYIGTSDSNDIYTWFNLERIS